MVALVVSVAVGALAIFFLLPLVERGGAALGRKLAGLAKRRRGRGSNRRQAGRPGTDMTPVLVGSRSEREVVKGLVMPTLASLGRRGEVFEVFGAGERGETGRLQAAEKAIEASSAAVFLGHDKKPALSQLVTAATRAGCWPLLLVPEDVTWELPQGVYRLDLNKAEDDLRRLLLEAEIEALLSKAEANLAEGVGQYADSVEFACRATEEQLTARGLTVEQVLGQLDGGEQASKALAQGLRESMALRRRIGQNPSAAGRGDAESVLRNAKTLIREVWGIGVDVGSFLHPLLGFGSKGNKGGQK